MTSLEHIGLDRFGAALLKFSDPKTNANSGKRNRLRHPRSCRQEGRPDRSASGPGVALEHASAPFTRTQMSVGFSF
jgi:hypothetical protein